MKMPTPQEIHPYMIPALKKHGIDPAHVVRDSLSWDGYDTFRVDKMGHRIVFDSAFIREPHAWPSFQAALDACEAYLKETWKQ